MPPAARTPRQPGWDTGQMSVLDPDLLQILACPDVHHAPLELCAADGGPAPESTGEALRCTECGRIFPIRDGIPVLLLSEATGGPAAPAR